MMLDRKPVDEGVEGAVTHSGDKVVVVGCCCTSGDEVVVVCGVVGPKSNFPHSLLFVMC